MSAPDQPETGYFVTVDSDRLIVLAMETKQNGATTSRAVYSKHLHLAGAQVHEQRFSETQETFDKLNRTEGPDQFQNLRPQIDALQQKVPRN